MGKQEKKRDYRAAGNGTPQKAERDYREKNEKRVRRNAERDYSGKRMQGSASQNCDEMAEEGVWQKAGRHCEKVAGERTQQTRRKGRRMPETGSRAGKQEKGKQAGKTIQGQEYSAKRKQAGKAIQGQEHSAKRKQAEKVIQGQEHSAKRRQAEKSPQAQDCPARRRCGGCQYLNLTYGEQLQLKQRQAERQLSSFCRVHRIAGMEQPLHYRNKVHAVFTHRRGTVVSGIYEQGTHEVVPVERCLLENEKADEIIGSIRQLAQSFKIKTYDEDTGYGLLRHVLIRTAHATGQIMVVLVLGSPILPSKRNFVQALVARHPEITTVVLNVNDKKTSMVLGDRETVLYGKGYIEDILCGCRFRISAKSFYQINSVQTEALYAKAMELAGLTGTERVIDAYCGIGTIGLVAAKQAGEVIGVELNRDAVRDAVRNARANNAENVRFYENDAGRFLVQMAENGEKADVVFMDPPRSGSDEAFLSSLIRLSPARIVYISCNPETQARDLQYLTKCGYRAEGAWPFDMFPFTEKIESIVLLSKLKSNHHIEEGQ